MLVTAAAQRPADYTGTSAQVGGDTVPTTLALCINSERTIIVPGLTCTKNRLRTDFCAKPVGLLGKIRGPTRWSLGLTADTPPGEVAEAEGRLEMITRNHPVRTLTFRKSSVTGEMACPLPAQRGPALSWQLTSEQSAMRRDEARFPTTQ